MRTGSAGNRSADDAVRTLAEPKRSAISSLRQKLLSLGFIEDVEFDSINVEPVLVYTKAPEKTILLKYKWDLVAAIPLKSDNEKQNVLQRQRDLQPERFVFEDEQGNSSLRFSLPAEEEIALIFLRSI